MNALKYLPIAACSMLLAVPAPTYGQETNAEGYVTYSSHEELVEAARAESGTLMVTMGHDQDVVDEVIELFTSKYDFVEAQGQEVGDADARILLELQAGTHQGDIIHVEEEEGLDNYYPHLYKLDFLAMAKEGVVDIPVEMINPEEPQVVAVGSALAGVSYNADVLPAHLVPDSYEDLLNPELKDSGLLWTDVSQATGIAALFTVWGEDRVIDYAKKLGEQNPVWTTGATRSITAMAAGETAIGSLNHYHSVVRIQQRDAPHIRAVLIEPVPVRLNELLAINANSTMPATAALFIEFTASLEVQEIFNREGPIQGSVFREGSEAANLVEGKEIAFVGWDDIDRIEEIQDKIFEAWGFPVAQPR